VSGTVRLSNISPIPQTVKKHEHVGEISLTYIPEDKPTEELISIKANKGAEIHYDHTADISVDPDNILSPSMKEKFHSLHQSYKEVFIPEYPEYNHAFGQYEAVMNMGNVKPPQRKGGLP
jgi:hypothetical protein